MNTKPADEAEAFRSMIPVEDRLAEWRRTRRIKHLLRTLRVAIACVLGGAAIGWLLMAAFAGLMRP